MPSDDYASFSGGGALKLKGGKVHKSKKKKKQDTASDLERALSTGERASDKRKKDTKERDAKGGGDDEGEGARSKKVGEVETKERSGESDNDEHAEYKTEAERRHEEYKRKKMLELSKSSSARPELLKTHKERVEELNTYLSKLSEHHDMPKIGPG
ncbi:hypothetical protein BX600DRAFT_463780 [Xylariales sp. PMI_506]|nr:hypothetical protein BX600DRAFT_463780 [Xylariales sp. PMI_506]